MLGNLAIRKANSVPHTTLPVLVKVATGSTKIREIVASLNIIFPSLKPIEVKEKT